MRAFFLRKQVHAHAASRKRDCARCSRRMRMDEAPKTPYRSEGRVNSACITLARFKSRQ